ncbi:retrovirus-related Pol polyprotein from type-1 retrotransposable element R2 [Clonorchis sinensis]|uniref:Retrovirus-related Pol polyprotein from type-1 retrotransposable element R2 n=1 Tax=Clonorchis sinensis TaxID=79923 RepID=G7YC95_CLOSI|nr:retrovirus-related Pol polyprotein from type-1 retrotransposable element R2 [Clonorchis sinensis]
MPQLAYQFHDTLVDGFAFADDWVVCAESQARLKEKLEAAAVELGRAGMKINARKTKAMVICGDRKHRATAVSVEPFCFAEELFTPLGPTDTVTYLGIPFTFKGKGVFNHRQHLLKLLDESECNNPDAAESAYGKAAFYSVPCTTQCGQRFRIWQGCSGSQPLSNRWLVFPERVFSRIFIRGIQLRCNLLRTRVRSARHGHGGQTILCRGNCGQPDSLVHILQSCWITHDARCARHNRVARELAKRLRRLGYTVFEELRAPTSTSFIKPDLIAVRERRATVIDVSIVSDGRGVTVWNEKKQKYGADEFSLAIISALRAIGCDVDFLVHQPMIISYRGICFPQSAKAVIGLGLSKVTVSDLRLLAIVGSLRTYDTFMRGTWR